MNGSTYQRCGCRDADGKPLGGACPELTKRTHGSRYIAVRIDTSGGRALIRRKLGDARDSGKRDADAALGHIGDLVKLGPDAATVARIGDLIRAAGSSGPLPAADDVRRRLGLTGDLTGAQTCGQLFEEWFAAKRAWRESTRKGHREKLDQHILPVIRDVPAERLNASHIDAVFARIRERNAAIESSTLTGHIVGLTTQKHIHGVIRAALNWAVRNRRLMFNPAAGVELESAPRRAVVIYDGAQIAAFLDHAANDRLALLFRLVLLRGLRRGEAVGLRWTGVDLDARQVRIYDPVLQIGGKVSTGRTKTAAGERHVSLDEATCEALRAHKAVQAAHRLAWAQAYEDNDLVFAREDGSPLRPDQVSKRFKQLAEAAGLPVIRLHDGRHSAASLGLAAGLDIKIVSDQLGHSTTTITRDLYQHVTTAIRDDAAERVAALIQLPKRHDATGA